MDAWHCLKVGTGPGDPGLQVKVNGQYISSPSPKGDTVVDSWVRNTGHSLAWPRGWHFLNLQVSVKCHVLQKALPGHPSKVAQRPKAHLRRQSTKLERGKSPDNMVESSTFMLLAI